MIERGSHEASALRLTDHLHVPLRGGFRIDQLERLIEAITPLSSLTEPVRVAVDLSGLAFIGPASLATLMASLADAIERGLVLPGSAYLPPRNRLVARYLDRMGFSKRLIGADVDRGFARRVPVGFRPAQAFTTQEQLAGLCHSLTMAATEALAIQDTDRLAVLLAVTEIARNVLDHAESAVGGVAVAQRARSRREFEIAVADSGIGIAASLRRNPTYRHLRSDADAITTALGPGVSSNPGDWNSGVGLTAIRSLLWMNGGTLLIRSGSAAVEDGRRSAIRENLTCLRGTVVTIRMRTGKPFDIAFYRAVVAAADQLLPPEAPE